VHLFTLDSGTTLYLSEDVAFGNHTILGLAQFLTPVARLQNLFSTTTSSVVAIIMEEFHYVAYEERVEGDFDTQVYSAINYSVMDPQLFDGTQTPDPGYLMFIAKEALKMLGCRWNHFVAAFQDSLPQLDW
jgi:hypothetical protein